MEDRLARLEGRCTTSPDFAEPPAVPVRDTPRGPLWNPPGLHTAAANKMLQCWPRIRLSLSGTDMDPARYLDETTGGDWLLEASGREAAPLALSEAVRSVETFYGACEAPALLSHLIHTYPGLSKSHVVESLRRIHPGRDGTVDPMLFPIPLLVILSVALGRDPRSLGMPSTSERCLSVALERQWTLHGRPDDLVPLSLAMAVCLVYVWARPVHALGVLRSVDAAIRQLSLRGSPLLSRAYAKLSFILEGLVNHVLTRALR